MKASKPALRQLGLLVLSFGLAACLAVAWHLRDSPRVMVLAVLGALLLWALHWRLAAPHTQLPVMSEGEQAPAPGPDELARLRAALRHHEARLEHAPMALFQVSRGEVQPLNSGARRIAAPGYASDLGALYAQLAAEPAPRRRLISFDAEHGVERALASSAVVVVDSVPERLVALMPVEGELEAEALRAWQQLVRVLTHEIMNSLTPVSSLSGAAQTLIDEVADQLPAALHQDLSVALAAIGRRATSLADFVASYRSLSAVPEPRAEVVAVADVLARLAALVGPVWRQNGGEASFKVEPPSLSMRVDAGQLEQALLNLAQNAFEAVRAKPGGRLAVHARLGRGGRLRIEVADNGPGVPAQDLDKIFTPFFSTKSKSRGIGLALVRQLVHGNGGAVRYAKSVHGGACFIVTF